MKSPGFMDKYLDDLDVNYDAYKKFYRNVEDAETYKSFVKILDFTHQTLRTNRKKYQIFLSKNKNTIIDFFILLNKLSSIEEENYPKSQHSQKRANLKSFAKELVNDIEYSEQTQNLDSNNINNNISINAISEAVKIAKNEYQESIDILNKNITDIKQKSEKEYTVYKNTLDEVNTQHQNALIKFKNHMKALTEDTNLLASKNYWKKKSFWHSIKAIISFIIFFIILSSLPFYIYKSGHIPQFVTPTKNNSYDFTHGNKLAQIVEEEKQKSLKTPTEHEKALFTEKGKYKNYLEEQNSKNSTLKDPEFVAQISNYTLYFFLISILIWISKIILKIALSNLHLSEEAREKKTMILTYLALIKEGAGLEDDDRKLILDAIFRPSTNGLIKDESNVTLLDIANIFKGK